MSHIINIAMVTGDRSPEPNYVGATLRALVAQGVDPQCIQLFPTTPDIRWLEAEHIPPVNILLPERTLNSVQNGVRIFQYAEVQEWLLYLEDDLSFCADFLGSVDRWLTRYASPIMRAYAFCALRSPEPWAVGRCHLPQTHLEAWPLWSCAGCLTAAAIRKEHVDQFSEIATRQLPTWRKGTPTPPGWGTVSREDWEGCGLDVMFHDWTGDTLASNPSFVQHEGDQSLANRFHEGTDGSDVRRCEIFAGHDWRYTQKVT